MEPQGAAVELTAERAAENSDLQVSLALRETFDRAQHQQESVLGERLRAELPGRVGSRDAVSSEEIEVELVIPFEDQLPQLDSCLTGPRDHIGRKRNPLVGNREGVVY